MRLPLYFGWEIDILRIRDLREHIIGPFKTYRGYIVTVALIVLAVSTTIFFRQDIKTLAATYNWLQTSWAGGTSVTNAAHPDDRLNWTTYSAKDDAVSAGTELTLSLSTSTTTETTDTDFDAGTHSSTVTSGSGDSASVVLDATNYSFASWDTTTPGYQYYSSTGVGSMPRDIAISGTKAYVIIDSNLDIIDISDPTNSTRLSRTDMGLSNLSSVDVYSTYAIVTNGTSIKIYDVSNAASPSLTKTLTSGDGIITTVTSILVSGTYLYVGGNDFRVVDLTDPANPVLRSTMSTRNTITGIANPIAGKMAKSGNYVYAARWGQYCDEYGCEGAFGGIQSIDVSTPTAATEASYLSTTARHGIAIIGNYAYSFGQVAIGESTGETNGYITNISTPTSLSAAGTFTLFSSSKNPTYAQIVASDGYLYLTENTTVGGWGLKVFSTTNPTSPNLEATLTKVNSDSVDFDAIGLAVSGNYVYLGAYRYAESNHRYGLMAVSQRGYASSGTFTSQAIDTTANQGYTNIDWTATTPTNTTFSMKVRSADSADMSGATAWASCSTVTDGSDITGGCVTDAHRYVQYQASFGSSDTDVSPTLSDVAIGYQRYAASATLTSSAYDAGDPTSVTGGLQWTMTEPAGTNVKFQIRTAPDSSGSPGTWTDWLGPTSTGDYYVDSTGGETANPTHTDGVNDQWMQYKIWLESSTGLATPSVSDITLVYVVNAAPNFLAAPTAEQSSDGTVAISYTIRDADTSTGQVANQGYVTPSFEYSIDDGSSWNAITTGLAAGATDRKAIEEIDYTTYTTTWDAKDQIDGIFASAARIRVTIDDGEGANNTASSPTAAFSLDVKDPTLGDPAISINATTTPALVALSASDDSLLQMQVSLASDFSGSGWEDYATTKTLALASDPDTVYARFRDAYGNTTVSQSVVNAETPLYPIIRDVSNTLEPNYQLFVSWKTVTLPGAGFGAYYVWRSTDNGANYSLVRTITDRTLNYYLDANLDNETSYQYRISSIDGDGNGSFFSGEVSDTPDGQGGTDETPPTISNVSAGSISTQSATITWDTDELSDSTVGYSTTAGNFATEIGVATMLNTASGVGRHSVTITGLTPNTTYYVQVESTDPENNTDTDNNGGDGYSFTTLAGPSISNVSASRVQNTQATITWQTDQAADSSVTYSVNSDLSNPQTELNVGESVTDHSVTITGLTGGTTYYFSVASGVATDTNGGNYYSLTTTLDAVAPVITSVASGPVTDTQALITWLTNEEADSRVWYGESTGSYSTSTAQDAYMNVSHAVTLSDLTPATLYYYVVVSSDLGGNTATSSEATLTTSSTLSTEAQVTAREEIARQAGRASASSSGGGGSSLDSQAPTILNIKVQDITSDTARITWATNEIANSFVQFGRSENYGELHGAWEYRTEHSVILDHLTPNVTYHFRVASADKAGNVRTGSDSSFITGDGQTPETDINEGESAPESESAIENAVQNAAEILSDLASSVSIQVLETSLSLQHDLIDRFSSRIPGPLISGEPRVSLTATTAEISWATDKEANSLIAFASADEYREGADEPYISEVGDAEEKTTKHTVLLTGLAPDTVYHYQIRSKTPVSSIVKTSDFNFRTLKKSLEITNYTIDKVADDEVILRWATNSDASSEVRITPYRNSVRSPEEARLITAEGFTSIHQIEATDLEAGTLYDVDLISRDLSGTEATKTIYAFSTSQENTPPIITQIKTESALSPGKDPKVQTIISWVTNEAATSRVYYQEGVGTSLDEFQESTALDSSFTRKHVSVLTSFKPGAVYRFRVESTDSSGLTTLSSVHTILTPRQTESVFQVIVKNIESTFGWVRDLR